MTGTPISVALLGEALGYIPASLPRDEWARVGMAIKSEFPDDAGWGLFRDWSASDAAGFDEAAALSTWRSIKAGGGVGVSTLLYLAKQHGFKLPRRSKGPHVSGKSLQGRAVQKSAAAKAAEEAQQRAAHQAVAQQAVQQWEAASTTGSSAYLQRKGVMGYGVRYAADGCLLVPLRDEKGELWNVQRIAPVKPAKGPDKLFLKGGRKSGLWHMLGSADAAETVLLAEGYATAASLRQATGLPVAMTEYIQTRKPGAFASCTDRIGWHKRAFVLPHETIGDKDERIVFQSDAAMENTFRIKRGVDDWIEHVGRYCAGNSRMVFAVCCAFAGPMLRPAGMESGGFHIRGGSSSGKTTAARIAASVYGGPDYMQRWRTTDNALEVIAAQHCDSLLILDELSQVDGKVAGDCAYMLANEQSKARSTRTGAARSRLSWRLLFLSTGELSLTDHMAEGGKRSRTGQDVRMADIPAEAGKGWGAFEHLHGQPDPASLALVTTALERRAHAKL